MTALLMERTAHTHTHARLRCSAGRRLYEPMYSALPCVGSLHVNMRFVNEVFLVCSRRKSACVRVCGSLYCMRVFPLLTLPAVLNVVASRDGCVAPLGNAHLQRCAVPASGAGWRLGFRVLAPT